MFLRLCPKQLNLNCDENNSHLSWLQDDLTVDDLYKIYAWDEKWMRLSRRKKKLKNLMMKVQQYQFERTKESAYIRTERILEAEDIDRYCQIF